MRGEKKEKTHHKKAAKKHLFSSSSSFFLLCLSAFSFHIQHSKNMKSSSPSTQAPVRVEKHFAVASAGEVTSFHLLKERFQMEVQIGSRNNLSLCPV